MPLEESRKALMASWNPVLRRDGECFSIDAGAVPSLAYPDHVLHAGPANGDLLAWPTDAVHLGLGPIPLSLQSAFIQARISGPDGALRWMQRVTVDPPLEEQRDLAALASHMGLRVFHDWMRAMLGGDTLPVGGGAWDEDAGSPGNRPQSPGYDRLDAGGYSHGLGTRSQSVRQGRSPFYSLCGCASSPRRKSERSGEN